MLFLSIILHSVTSQAQNSEQSEDIRRQATPQSPDQIKTQSVENNSETQLSKIKPLTISSWGGAYSKAQNLAIIAPFKKTSKYEILLQKHSGNFEEIKTKLNKSELDWDVIDLSYDMVEKACKLKLIAPIDHTNLEPSPKGKSAQDDFLKNTLHRCGVGSMTWASTIIFNIESFKRKKPSNLKDIFNIKRFPGKRTLPKTAQNVLEIALMADGIKPNEIYSLLEKPEGVKKAFNNLNKIKKHIIWWSKPSEAFKLLSNGKASMGIAYNGRAFSVIAVQKKPLQIIWDGQIYDYNLWAIPKNAKNKNKSIEFIRFATAPKQLANQASLFPYGPTRISANQEIGLHPEAGIDLKPFIPTISRNRKLALQRDIAWWEQHEERLNANFLRWVKNLPEPDPTPELYLTVSQSPPVIQTYYERVE